jgi:hypothetical protein
LRFTWGRLRAGFVRLISTGRGFGGIPRRKSWAEGDYSVTREPRRNALVAD